MADRNVTVKLTAEVSGFKQSVKESEAAVSALSATVKGTGEESKGAMGRMATLAREQEQAWSTLSTTALVAGGSMVAGVGAVVAKYASFDKAMSAVQASTHASGEEMNKLRELAMRAGADTAYSGEEAAAGINELAKAGVSTNDILKGGLTGALSLAAAGEIEVADAAELAATAMTQFNLEGSDLEHVADLLAAGAGKAQGSVGDLGYALKQSGLVASQAGISIEETVGALSAFAANGLIGSDAGTSFKVMLQKLQNPSKEARGLLEELGVSMYDSQGQFVGLANLADQLRAGMENMVPAQRDAAMATIFGSDAVRAANVLYAEGGDGIRAWTEKVNDAGYAAETAAALQDNLAGDLEKLGGAFDTIALQSGGSLNDMFRDLVQWATSFLEAIGEIPGPVLTTGAAIVGLAGGGALLAGGFMKAVSFTTEFRDTLRDLGVNVDKVDGKLGKIGRNLGLFVAVGGAAAAAVGAFGKAAEQSTIGTTQMSNALADSENALGNLDAQFRGAEWANANGNWFNGTVHGINSVSDAIINAQNLNWAEEVGSWATNALGFNDATAQMKNSIGELDQTLAGLPIEEATGQFGKLAQQVKDGGGDMEKLRAQFPELEKAVLDYASSLGVTLEDQEVFQAMMGELPPKLVEAADAAEQAGAGTQVMGDAMAYMESQVRATIPPLDELVEGLRFLGDLHVSETEAMGKFSEALTGLQTELIATGATLDATGTRFDTTTEAGRSANDMVHSMVDSMWKLTEAQANNGASQETLQGTMRTTYDALVVNMQQLGLTAEQADVLARSVLGVPDDVSIETWMSENAQRIAESTSGAVDAIDKNPNVNITATDRASATVDSVTGKMDNLKARSPLKLGIEVTENRMVQETTLFRASKGKSMGGLAAFGGFATGGMPGEILPRLRGFARGGGILPGHPPANPMADNLPGLVMDTGEPILLRSREYIVNEPGTWRGENLSWLQWMNSGGTMTAPAPRGFAVGGSPGGLVAAPVLVPARTDSAGQGAGQQRLEGLRVTVDFGAGKTLLGVIREEERKSSRG